MKSKDFAALIGIGLLASLIGFILSSVLIKSPSLSDTIDTMHPIDKEFPDVHKSVYEEVFPAETIDTFSEIHASDTDGNSN